MIIKTSPHNYIFNGKHSTDNYHSCQRKEGETLSHYRQEIQDIFQLIPEEGYLTTVKKYEINSIVLPQNCYLTADKKCGINTR